MELSIIIVNWNCVAYTTDCIASILETTHLTDYEIIVVDNASTDNSLEVLTAHPSRTTVLRSPDNVGFARANNLGASKASGRHLLFLNPDTKVIGKAIPRMLVALRSSPTIGAVGSRLLNADLTVQTSCVQRFPTVLSQILEIEWVKRRFPAFYGIASLFADRTEHPVDVEAVSGACVMMQRSTFEQVGGFSTDYFLYAEDLDLCFKVHRARLRVCLVPTAEVIHFGGGSSSKESGGRAAVVMSESIQRFLRKTRGRRYASAYRVAIAAVALARILLLGLALWLSFDEARLFAALVKWRCLLSWSLGREPWAAQLGTDRPDEATGS